MATVNLQTRSGNLITVLFDGKKIGLVRSIDASDDYAPEPASGIGDIHVVEYVPTMARHTLNVSTMILNVGALRAAGVAMENGDAVLQGLVMDIEVFDKNTGVSLRKYRSCSYASGSIQVQAHQILVNNAVFNALDVVGTGI